MFGEQNPGENSSPSSSLALAKPARFEVVTIPTKITKTVEWDSQLQNYIAEMGEDPYVYASEIAAFNRMRQDMRGAPATMLGIELIVNYYRQLDSLSRRLPLQDQPLNVPFVWFDAFDADEHVQQTSLAFEKANVLFNLAAIYSQMGNIEDSALYFQSTASVFTYVADNFLHPPLMDIRRPSLAFLTALMLAQAQESVVFKAAQENKSLTTLQRLAASAANYAREAANLLCSQATSDLAVCLRKDPSGNDRDAFALVFLKADLWEAISCYFRAENCYLETKVGEAIASFKRAENHIKECNSKHVFDSNSIVSDYVNKLSATLKSRIAAVEKENGLIYNQMVPDSASLTPIEGASLVKIMSITDCTKNIPRAADLFKKLLPLKVHEEVSKYSEEKSKLLRYETMKANTADTDLQSTLASLGFPTTLDNLAKEVDPNQLPEEIKMLSQKGRNLSNSLKKDDIGHSFSHLEAILLGSTKNLDQEIATYQKLRIEHGNNWTQDPSHIGNAPLFNELNTLYENLADVSRQVANINSSIPSDVRSDFALLVGPEGTLLSVLPTPDTSLITERRTITKKIRDQLDALDKLNKERTRNLESLRDAIIADDISDTLAIAKSLDTMSLFHDELAKFDDKCRFIEQNISQHNELLREFKSAWSAAASIIETKDQRLTNWIMRFERGVEVHGKIAGSLQSCADKVTELAKRITTIADKVEQFTQKRTADRERILSELRINSAQTGQAYLMDRLKNLSMRKGSDGNNFDPVQSKSQRRSIDSIKPLNTAPISNLQSAVTNTVTNVAANAATSASTQRSKPKPELPPVNEPSLLD